MLYSNRLQHSGHQMRRRDRAYRAVWAIVEAGPGRVQHRQTAPACAEGGGVGARAR